MRPFLQFGCGQGGNSRKEQRQPYYPDKDMQQLPFFKKGGNNKIVYAQ